MMIHLDTMLKKLPVDYEYRTTPADEKPNVLTSCTLSIVT
jgi:hypothetical protein